MARVKWAHRYRAPGLGAPPRTRSSNSGDRLKPIACVSTRAIYRVVLRVRRSLGYFRGSFLLAYGLGG